MGSKLSRAVRPHGKAAAPAVVIAHLHNDRANGQTRQDPAPHLPKVCAHDDIDVPTSSPPSATSRRRDSAPSVSNTTAITTVDSERAAAFDLFLAERQLMDIDYAATEPAAPSAVPSFQTSPPLALLEALHQHEEETDPQCLTCCTRLPHKHEATHNKEAVYPCRRCSSAYCTSCVKNMFIDACKDLTRMPPKCCMPIHLHYARPYMSQEEVAEFKAKYEEWSTPRPFYCPVARCSTFIPERLLPERAKSNAKERRVDSGVGTPTASAFACPSCAADICADCRQIAHPDGLCNVAEFGLDAETAALLKAWGYKKCPKCGHGVKRMYGCNHMECRCGAHFCWVCLQNKDDCGGNCDEDEDGDYDGDYDSEPDEPEDLEEPVQRVILPDTAENPDLQVIADNLQEDGVTTATAASNSVMEATTPATTSPIPVVRPRNLDGGSHRYWEDQDLDFGEEPNINNQDRVWHCHHRFSTYKIPLAEAIVGDLSRNAMDCEKCWRTIYPELSAPTGSTSSVKTAPAGANGRPRGIVRASSRGGRRWHAPRGLFRTNATVGTAPHLTATISQLSQSVPAREASPMEDVQFTERVVDTYGNIITSNELDVQRRASVDVASAKQIDKTATSTSASEIFTTTSPDFSFAYECHFCSLLVCASCRDAALAGQQPKEDTPQLFIEDHPEEYDSEHNELRPSIFD